MLLRTDGLIRGLSIRPAARPATRSRVTTRPLVVWVGPTAPPTTPVWAESHPAASGPAIAYRVGLGFEET